MILAIDATYAITGGSVSQLIQFINFADPKKHNFEKIILFAPKRTLDLIKGYNFLIKHNICHNKFILKFFYNLFLYKKIKHYKCNAVLVFGGTCFYNFSPKIIISQNLLPFDKKILNKYFIKFEWLYYLKFLLLKFMQIKNLNKADGIIFFHKFTKKMIFKKINYKNHAIIPPFVNFRNINSRNKKKIICYITNYQLYKNDLLAAKALDIFSTQKNYEVYFLGKQKGKHFFSVKKYLLASDNKTIKLVDEIYPSKVLKILEKSEVFLLASSCENFCVSLLEAIMSKNFILSSYRQPFINILKDRAIYFNENNHRSIYSALNKYSNLNKNYKKNCIEELYKEIKSKNNSKLVVGNIFKYINTFLQ
jgi:hypothetical protein